MRKNGRKKVSFGTVFTLAITLLILGGSGFVWVRLSSGKTMDLTKMKADLVDLEIHTGMPEVISTVTEVTTPKPTTETTGTPKPEMIRRSYTLTVGGTVALEGEVRKNSYYTEAKQYDYSDIMMLLKKEIQSDLNIVFAENLFMDGEKDSDLISSRAGADMLKAAGFNTAACGFSKAYNKGEAGIVETKRILNELDIRTEGIYENDEMGRIRIINVNSVNTALLQYTNTIAGATRKTMTKNGQSDMVPAAEEERIAADISKAREDGADVVIVLLNWGQTGKGPDRNMKTLAQKIADAGADLIIGNGSRIVSGAEMLTADGNGRKVLCVWSLGTMLSGDRSNIKRISGILLKATISVEKEGRVEVAEVSYIPLYTWKYKQDSRFYYRCLAADCPVPDGMDQEQQKMMKKALDSIENTMKESVIERRKNE